MLSKRFLLPSINFHPDFPIVGLPRCQTTRVHQPPTLCFQSPCGALAFCWPRELQPVAVARPMAVVMLLECWRCRGGRCSEEPHQVVVWHGVAEIGGHPKRVIFDREHGDSPINGSWRYLHCMFVESLKSKGWNDARRSGCSCASPAWKKRSKRIWQMWQSQNHKQYPMYIAKNLPFKNIFDKGVDCPFVGNTFIGYGPKLLMPLRSDKGGIMMYHMPLRHIGWDPTSTQGSATCRWERVVMCFFFSIWTLRVTKIERPRDAQVLVIYTVYTGNPFHLRVPVCFSRPMAVWDLCAVPNSLGTMQDMRWLAQGSTLLVVTGPPNDRNAGNQQGLQYLGQDFGMVHGDLPSGLGVEYPTPRSETWRLGLGM